MDVVLIKWKRLIPTCLSLLPVSCDQCIVYVAFLLVPISSLVDMGLSSCQTVRWSSQISVRISF